MVNRNINGKISNKVIGFEQELKLFKNLFDIKKLPQTLMIQGLDGIGKYTFCLNLVSSLLKKNNTNIEDELISDSNVLILKNLYEYLEQVYHPLHLDKHILLD